MRYVQISKKQLETMGGRSLVAMVAVNEDNNFAAYPPGPVTLQFEQSSMDWKRTHGGPDDIIIPEHTPMCLCEDIIILMQMGYKIQVGSYESE